MEASALMKEILVAYPSDFPRFACGWRRAPAKEARLLWEEAERLAGGAIECKTATKEPVGPS